MKMNLPLTRHQEKRKSQDGRIGVQQLRRQCERSPTYEMLWLIFQFHA